MSQMTLFLLCAAFFVGGLAAGFFGGWLMGHAEGVDEGVEMASGRGKGWSI